MLDVQAPQYHRILTELVTIGEQNTTYFLKGTDVHWNLKIY